MTDVEIMSMGGESLDREEIGGGHGGGRGCGRGGDVVEVGDAAEAGDSGGRGGGNWLRHLIVRSSIYRVADAN